MFIYCWLSGEVVCGLCGLILSTIHDHSDKGDPLFGFLELSDDFLINRNHVTSNLYI